jgi:hypothetical protein
MFSSEGAEVRIRCYSHMAECEIRVAVHGKEMCMRCRDYNQALKWARLECRSYGVTSITVERVRNAEEGGQAIEHLPGEIPIISSH